MYEVKQAHVARAVDILRGGPLTAAAFAAKMWPDRRNVDGGERSRSQLSHAGHAFLRRLGALGYVDKLGELWLIHQLSGNGSVDPSANGLPNAAPNELANGSPNHSPLHRSDESQGSQADRLRLHRLVQQAGEPVTSVTHDAVFGDLRIRSIAVDAALVEACAIVVLSGHQANVYPPCSAPSMLVGLSPAEAARVLLLRWNQSGQAPELPRAGAWIRVPDGIIACPGFWRPAGAPASWVDPEDVRARVQRLRALAGLA
jgi:hypothetical protein